MEKDISSQMLKGILSGCILTLIAREPLYGYTLGVKLNEFGFGSIPKGTIYPLLLTLEKRNFIEGRPGPSEEGPMRKYYYMTEEGKMELEQFRSEWRRLRDSVENLLNEERE